VPEDRRAVDFEQLADANLVVDWSYRGGTAANVSSEPIHKLLPGTGNQGGFRPIGRPARDDVKAVALFSTGEEIGWPDALDSATGIFAYFGDNRKPGRDLEDTPRGGNRLLRQIFTRTHGTPIDRAKVPPFLLFDKPGRGRDVRFRGLLAPGGVRLSRGEDLVTVRGSEGVQSFQNYQAHFTVLNVQVISRAWIEQVLDGDPLGSECPVEWRAWVESRSYVPLAGSFPLNNGDQGQLPDSRKMLRLRDITRESVLRAIAEYDELGQEAFLARYGFDSARTYLLVHDGKTYDSKAIAGAAHGFLPGRRALSPGDFSGGKATVGRVLRGLGFAVHVGDVTADELIRLLERLDVNSPRGIPALYQPIMLLWGLSRASRGQPRLVSWQETRLQVAALIRAYGRSGEGNRVHYPVAALHGAGLWEIDAGTETPPNAHGSSILQGWFTEHQPRSGLVPSIYGLVRDSLNARQAAVRALTAFFVEADPAALLTELGLGEASVVGPAEVIFHARSANYQDLCQQADIYWVNRSRRRAPNVASRLDRSDAAREAVMLRSEGRCENPECAGDIEDVKDNGEPILEVDHIGDLAKGSPDNPIQMIALCPNCHRIKTYGRTRYQLVPRLLVVAEQRHRSLLPDH
jgi:5-methylcytosine-specific restriction protein A